MLIQRYLLLKRKKFISIVRRNTAILGNAYKLQCGPKCLLIRRIVRINYITVMRFLRV